MYVQNIYTSSKVKLPNFNVAEVGMVFKLPTLRDLLAQRINSDMQYLDYIEMLTIKANRKWYFRNKAINRNKKVVVKEIANELPNKVKIHFLRRR